MEVYRTRTTKTSKPFQNSKAYQQFKKGPLKNYFDYLNLNCRPLSFLARRPLLQWCTKHTSAKILQTTGTKKDTIGTLKPAMGVVFTVNWWRLLKFSRWVPTPETRRAAQMYKMNLQTETHPESNYFSHCKFVLIKILMFCLIGHFNSFDAEVFN